MLPYQLITTNAQLKAHLPQWRATPVLAMDTEIAHAHQVPSRKQCVSLVQLWDGSHEQIWLIDNFTVDLEPFIQQVMMEPLVTKLFHDAPHDLRMLRCPRRARSVVCTFAMAKSRLQPRCSLKELSLNLLGLPLDKQYQMSNWASRPLSPEQLYYAALDSWVTYHVWTKLSAIPVPTPLAAL
ncbi:hypothetical protein [Candidatus Cyanaurora vandensis]|uniref:hypothetical protein n=1 Tax=Candidatus Cyanaurora vandensis TaxID=2714958 RepID=UPI00257FA58E|nr:hypothetical protein [Candidatus Cyanaurora vandensis]